MEGELRERMREGITIKRERRIEVNNKKKNLIIKVGGRRGEYFCHNQRATTPM